MTALGQVVQGALGAKQSPNAVTLGKAMHEKGAGMTSLVNQEVYILCNSVARAAEIEDADEGSTFYATA